MLVGSIGRRYQLETKKEIEKRELPPTMSIVTNPRFSDDIEQRTPNGASHELEQRTPNGEAKLWELALGVVTSMALKAAVLLDIPGIISRSGCNAYLSVDDIASHLPSKDPERGYLSRILKFLSRKGLLSEKKRLSSSGKSESCYGINEVSMWLVGENLCFASMVLMQLDKGSIEAYHHLHDSVLYRQNSMHIAHGESLWEYGKKHPDFSEAFNDAMACTSRIVMFELLENYDGFKCIDSLVDVGGGMGQALSMIIAAYPHIRGINYDLPQVVASAPPIAGVDHLGGNMFESVPCALAVFMKYIMHNWSDDHCIKILKNCWTALAENGKVIIVEGAVDESDHSAMDRAQLMDMVMLAQTEGGFERRKDEWETLFNAAGFGRYRFTRFSGRSQFWVIELYRSSCE